MEKNQNAMGMTLSFRFSEAIHWIRKRMEKNACPTNPTDSQKCSLLIVRSCRTSLAAGRGGACPCAPPYPDRRSSADNTRLLHPVGSSTVNGRREIGRAHV